MPEGNAVEAADVAAAEAAAEDTAEARANTGLSTCSLDLSTLKWMRKCEDPRLP